MRLLSDVKPAALSGAPLAAAVATLGAGVMLLASGATPSEPHRFLWLLRQAPTVLIETSHFLSSVAGLLLVLLAFGLRRRLDGAWAASIVVLALAAPLTLLKGLNWEETAVLTGLFAVLLPLREAFDRRARVTQIAVTPGWLVSAAAVVLGAAALGWWSFSSLDAGQQPFWRVFLDRDEARAFRAVAGAGVLLLVFGLWRLIATPATPKVVGEADPDFHKVRAILASAADAAPEANLALLGDKRFLFSESGKSFLMFGVRGRSWIAMGPPVGDPEERQAMMWSFREQADAHAARPAFYGVGPDVLPELVELGFAIQKTGESAAVSLEAFTLAGRRREVLRRNWRKAAEGGATFEVVFPPHDDALMARLRRLSDAWLAQHAGGEKTFSLGGFEPRYVGEFPIALVRAGGEVVAFATLWTTGDKQRFSMDLMRYGDDAPKNIMDFLFVELLTWGRAQGFAAFDFGVAPLAGLQDRPLAPILSRVGRLLYEHGEELYNFQGVRRYKDKYDPAWEPRYVAAPNKWAIPRMMADVSLLSAGGVGGLTKRPKREAPARPSVPGPAAA